MNAIKSPMPTAMANLSDMGMACMTASRRFVSTRTVTIGPSTTMTAIACCQLSPRPSIRVNKGEGRYGVQAEPGGQGHRVVREDPRRYTRERSGHAGREEHTGDGETGALGVEDRRV